MSDFKDYDPPPMPDTSTVLSRVLRANRIAAEVNLRSAAAIFGISATELSDIESGRTEPSHERVKKMIAFYAEVRRLRGQTTSR